MITEKQVTALAEAFLQGTELFLIEVVIKPTHKISVFIDGLQGVTIEGCQRLSRHLEEQIDREKEDFDLTVSSPGADRPLKDYRQFIKNNGRSLEIVMKNGDKTTGKVTHADAEAVTIEPLPEKKRSRVETLAPVTIPYTEITTAKEVITFKK